MKLHFIRIGFAIVIVSSVFTFSQAAGTYSGGSGDPDDPYIIADANDMQEIGANTDDWDKHFELINDIDLGKFTGTEFNIIGYIIIRPLVIPPIGVPFSGVFEGNDNVIYNFTYSSNDRDNVGLFGYVDGTDAEIRNLTLIAPDVNGATKKDVGSVIGVLDAGHVLNCKVEGGSIYGNDCIGGLAGHVTLSSGRISNCYSSAKVSGDSSIGGLVGSNTGWITPGGGGKITKSIASGDINGNYSVGGLVGTNCRLISDCYASGDVSGNVSTGGLVGFNYEFGIVSRSYSTGTVEGHDKSGGIAGWNYGGKILNCYSAADVDGINSTGGLVGSNMRGIGLSNMVSNCYAAGNVNGINDTGGLVGYDGSNSFISSSYNKNFWDSFVNSGLDGIGSGSDPNVIGKTTAEMHNSNTFLDAGWDFAGEDENGVEDIWTIKEGEDYPRLLWEMMDPIELLDLLADDVVGLGLHEGIENSLLAKIDTAIDKLEDDNENNDGAAINLLQAFINAVEAQSGKKITEEDAEYLINAAQQIIDLLSTE